MRPTVFLAGMLILSVGCAPGALNPNQGDSQTISGGASSEEAEMAKTGDQEIAAILAGKDEDGDKAVPVDEFFAKLGNGYMIWKGEVEWFKKLAAEAKAAGAPAMHAVVSEAFGAGTGVCAQYIITLPAEKESRAKVIEAYNNFWRSGWEQLSGEERKIAEEEFQSELAKDVGQKYLMLSYDP